jgi:hypothetical protein
MTRSLKKLLRTVQTCFPGLLDTKFRVMRFYRNTLGIPFENDFNALSLFPQVDVLVVPVYKQWPFDGLASFNEAEAADWLKGRIFFFKERFLTLRKSRCSIKRLDDLGLAPFFIKLDVQGYEYKALQGGEKTITTHEPVLLIESPNDGLVAYLMELGFYLYAFDRGRFVPGIRGAPNTFFMTEKKAALVRNHIEKPKAATAMPVAALSK